MTDALRRTLRTFFQSLLGSLLTSGVLSAASENGVVDWSAAKKAVLSALAAGIIAAVTLIHNLLEDHTAVPAVLKDDKGVTAIELCLIVITAVLVAWAAGWVPR